MNRELQRIIPTVHVHLIRRRYSLSDETRFDDYARIAEAILAGDGAGAERASREHIARTMALVRAHANGDAPPGSGRIAPTTAPPFGRRDKVDDTGTPRAQPHAHQP